VNVTSTTSSEALDERDVTRVLASYDRIEARSSAVALAFFVNLQHAPTRVRRVFKQDDADQRTLAKEVFDVVVGHLQSPRELRALLERMGRRGLVELVSPSDIDAIGRTLVSTLRDFDESWSSEVEHAWTAIWIWAVAAVRRGHAVRRGSFG
jgi:hemoglobin-like flavoprotein